MTRLGRLVGAALNLIAWTAVAGCGVLDGEGFDALGLADGRRANPATAEISTASLPGAAPRAGAREAESIDAPADLVGPIPHSPPGCKTVELYRAPKLAAAADASAAHKAYLGYWGPGLWDGKLCHELVVERIDADGAASVYLLEGYYTPWDRWPTAFRRDARFLETGALAVDLGPRGRVVYQLRDGVMYAVYDWGVARAFSTMSARTR